MTTLRTTARRPRRLGPVGLILAMLCSGTSSAQPPAPESPPIVWSRLDLNIPYRWTGGAERTQEVVLFYSADRGRSWRRAGSAAAHVRAFAFRAPEDGEYWFAIRSYDAAGRATPPTPLGPEMRVVVDTQAPTIERLDASLQDGRLDIVLEASDSHRLNDRAVSLYARADGQPAWAPIQPTQQPSTDSMRVRAAASWTPPPGAGRVEIRATVADAAGNRQEQAAEARAGSAAGGAPLVASAAAFSPFSVGMTEPTRTDFGGGADPFVVAEWAPWEPAPARSPPSSDGVAEAATSWPAETVTSAPLVRSRRADDAGPFRSAGFRADPFAGFTTSSGATAEADHGASVRRLVNSTEFEFEYELEDAGRWGVAKVELWGTADGGRSWRRFAIDSDRQSPIRVATPGEGDYGFRLLVESVGGLESSPPRPGEAPEAFVTVDLQSPRAAILSAGQGQGYFADQLSIEWSVDDQHLAENPIGLFYSNRPAGPWIPIATSLANNGRHDWRLQRHLPRRLYLKLEARDSAGNTGTAVSPDAIEIDVPTASGSLRGVRAR